MFLLLVFAVNIIWSVFSTWGVELTRTSSATRKQVGDIFSESFEIVNRSFIPKAWLKITDRSEFLSGAGSRVLTWIGGSKPRTYLAYATLNKRGWFDLGPTQIESGDLFGMLLFRKSGAQISSLLVIPHTFDITKFAEPWHIAWRTGAAAENAGDVPIRSVSRVRTGDPLKRIHWPTSARKQALIVKEFEKDPLAEV